MKYIKLFNEARVEGTRMTKWYQPDQSEDLLDFSNGCLAYLMDDGYKIATDNSSNVYDSIRIRKGDSPFTVYQSEVFTWNEVKDIVLPYLILLNRKYELEYVTFHTNDLSRSISFTKDGAAKIKDLLYEEEGNYNYYSYINNYNFGEIVVRVMKLPLIHNNESFDVWSRDQKDKLKDYCETNLAYLVDEGFQIRVGQVNSSSSLLNKLIHIQIKYEKTPSTLSRDDFEWSEVKDHIIPFILRLERKYEIEKIRFLGDDTFHYIKNDFEEELDKQPLIMISYLDIYLKDEKQINESMSHREELEDFCDTHLAYLTDKNFSTNYLEFYGGNLTELTIRTMNITQIFTWDEVKDYFIPFLHMLSKEYRLFDFHFEDFNCKKDKVICFKTFMGHSYYYSYEDVINDNIDTNIFTNSYGLYLIKIKVSRKLR